MVRLLINGLCSLTIAASAWLGLMFVILQRPGYERGLAVCALFVLQSLLSIAVTGRWLSGPWWRVAAFAGAIALAWAGASAIAANSSATHFEGYALIIGLLLLLQGLLTAARLITATFTQSSKVLRLGN